MLFFPPRLAPKVRARSAASTSSGTVRPSQGKLDRKSTRLNSSHSQISYAVFCLKKKNKTSHSALALSHPPPTQADIREYQPLQLARQLRHPALLSPHATGPRLQLACVYSRQDSK